MDDMNDVRILRDLVKRYRDCCHWPGQEELRALWRRHNSLETTRPLVTVFPSGNMAWKEIPESVNRCSDPLFVAYESWFNKLLWVASLEDDTVFDPFIGVHAERVLPPNGHWGVSTGSTEYSAEGGRNMYHDVPIKSRADMHKLVKPRHLIDEEKTRVKIARMQDALGDILPVVPNRAPAWMGFAGDISSDLALMIGLEQMMMLMCEDPEWLHEILAFMRDGVLGSHDAADAAGDFSLFNSSNQAMAFSEELPDPGPGRAHRKDLWGYFAAQEFTGVSPEMHEEFLLRYQMPIMRPFGLVAYGCCEDLTRKIDMLRQVPNLRRIAVTPVADVARCAEQIKRDYVLSWRPNPADVCCNFDEARVRRVIRDGLAATRNCYVDIALKDISTVQNEPARISRWVRIVREEIERSGA